MSIREIREKIKCDKQELFFKRLFQQAQLDEEEQKSQAITLLPVAVAAIAELQEARRQLLKDLLDAEERHRETLNESLSEREQSSKLAEETTEILKEHLQLLDTATENRLIYEKNTDILFGEVHKVKTMKRSEFASETGSKKNHDVRNKSYAFLRRCINSNPELSINRLATMLVDQSTESKTRFGRVIPISTAKDYARFIKKEVESRTQHG